MDELARSDGVAQAAAVRSGALTARELLEAAIARIEAHDGPINAVPIRLFERALAEVPGRGDGPLWGVPTVVKDSLPTAGDPWHRGMRVLRDAGFRAEHEPVVVARLRHGGLQIVGKANVGELEGGITTEPVSHGATSNPWDLHLSVGGSSGGSAAAVAAGLVPIALGVDGGGSVRIPASLTGTVGIKPSRGVVSMDPVFVEDGASTAGFVARSVRDCAAALDVCAGVPHGDHWAAPGRVGGYLEALDVPPPRLRIGMWTPRAGGVTAAPACLAACDAAAALLESLGHHVEVGHPVEIDAGFFHTAGFLAVAATHIAQQVDEVELALGRALGPEDLEPVTWAACSAARQLTVTGLLRGLAANRRAAVRYGAWWDGGFDLLVTPTLAVVPYPNGALAPATSDQPWPDVVSWVPFTPHANLSGQPAISLPLHHDAVAGPIGVQLVGRVGADEVLLRVAAQLEAAAPWAARTPPHGAWRAVIDGAR